MTHLLIKSFNRPYYLDRCLQSAYRYVKGDFKIIVLDDGTPEKYLNKIQENFPQVEIRKSEQYEQKSKAIQENLENGKEIDGFQIPTKLWYDAVKNASDYVLVTEDDVWFTQEIDLNVLVESMRKYNMILLKLGWISKRKITSEMYVLDDQIIGIQPKIFSAPRWFLKNFIFQNKFKVYSFLYRLGIVNANTMNEYWVLNALLMGLYKKEYWLAIWKSLENRTDEQEQILNAIEWYRKNGNKNTYGKLEYEMMKTTFQTSATNSYHRYGKNFDVNHFNHIMNQAWFNNSFDVMDNFPADISKDLFIKILQQANHPRALPENWLQWSEKFKDQYRKQQVEVD